MLTSPRATAALSGTRAIIEDGQDIDLFRDSIVSGRTNPMGVGVHVVRRGDAAVAVTTLGPAFEGAPGRAHGGVVGAILDETMGHVLPIIGEMAYTANLTIDYIGPAPLGVRSPSPPACETAPIASSGSKPSASPPTASSSGPKRSSSPSTSTSSPTPTVRPSLPAHRRAQREAIRRPRPAPSVDPRRTGSSRR